MVSKKLESSIPRFALAVLLFLISSCTEIDTTSGETSLSTNTTVSPSPTFSPNAGTPSQTQTTSPTRKSTLSKGDDIPLPTKSPVEINFHINPLTGLEVVDLEALDRRPIAVKVQLFPRGQRPPWGISMADIVYDYYQNNGVTRLTAIFYGTDAEQVGPIRSARLFDVNLIKMYKTFFVFGLADWRIYQRLKESPFSDRLVVEHFGSCPPLCRTDPDGYNHLILDTGKLKAYLAENNIPNQKQELIPFVFSDTAPKGGKEAEVIFVRISYSAYSRWDYNPITTKYLRFQDAQEGNPQEEVYQPLLDQLTGGQISADNVLILFLGHRYAYQTKAGENEVFNIKFNGNGEAKAFRDGKMYNLTWKRNDTDQLPEFTLADGTPYSFKPGNTWFHIIGKTSSREQVGQKSWRFEFKVP